MARLPQIKQREAIRLLGDKLRIELRFGREIAGWLVVDNKRITKFSVRKAHGGSSDLSAANVRDLQRKSLLNRAAFTDLVNCPLGYDDYIAALRRAGHV